jgi:CRP-like cAMP-binding protein
MPAPVELLQRVPLFEGLERNDLESIARSFKERTVAPGEAIATEGQAGVGFFVIGEGEAVVTVGGNEVNRLRAGDHFGEIALIDDGARSATITAETQLRCYGLTPWEFRPFVENNASIAWKMLQTMAQQLRRATEREG